MYLAGFVAVGVALNLVGPALPALQAQVGVGVSAISALFVAQSAGYLAGSLLAGPGYDRGHGHRLLALSLLLMAAGAVAVPACTSLVALCAAFALLAFGSGVVDVGSNSMLVWKHGASVGPRMNALHFAFGVGALCAPIAVNRSLAWLGGLSGACALAAAGAVAVAAMAWRHPAPPGPSTTTEGRAAERFPLAIVSVFFLLYVALELGFAGWIYSYAEALKLGGENLPAALTAGFWAAFTASRLVAVGLSRRLSPVTLLWWCAAVTALGIAVVVASPSAEAAWLGTVLFAAGLAPQYATMVAYAGRHLSLTGSATSWLVSASAVGGLLFPWAIGQAFDELGPTVMPRLVAGATAVTIAWLAVITRVLGRRPRC